MVFWKSGILEKWYFRKVGKWNSGKEGLGENWIWGKWDLGECGIWRNCYFLGRCYFEKVRFWESGILRKRGFGNLGFQECGILQKWRN